MYQYKCIPAPMNLIVKSEKEMGKAVSGFGDLINSNSTDGWEFYSMEQIACTKPAGCLSSLFGAKDNTTYYNMLIFRKQII